MESSSEFEKDTSIGGKIFGWQFTTQTDLRESLRKGKITNVGENKVNNLRVQRTRQAVWRNDWATNPEAYPIGKTAQAVLTPKCLPTAGRVDFCMFYLDTKPENIESFAKRI